MAYCAYCKSHIFDVHRKCPNCGGTQFLTDDEPVAIPVQQEPTRVEYHTVYIEKPVYHEVYKPVYVQRTQSDRSWVATLLLCLVFGYWGFHRFYVGKVGSGIFYLFTFGWCGIGWLIDLILILTGAFKDKDGLPVRH